MSFKLREYVEPNFNDSKFLNAPDAKLVKAPKDHVAPENYHAMSIYPEYFKINGQWLLAKQSRMDCVAIYKDNEIHVLEFRNIKKDDLVVVGRSENCEDGIYLYTNGFNESSEDKDVFAFRMNRSRETAFSKDYDEFYELLKHEKDHGKIVWVLGPAVSFDKDSKDAFSKLATNGYVHALLAGNALATHDLEGSYLKTALGQDIYTQESIPNGHYHHLDTINRVRYHGDIKTFIEKENIDNGIIYALEKNNIPYVLAGSIRDDGPLPPVLSDVYEAQEKMREQIKDATTVVCMATMLHSIAVGNMTPSYRIDKYGKVRQVYFYCVDISEFTANKLADRGSLSAKSIITNVQDFMVHVAKGLDLY